MVKTAMLFSALVALAGCATANLEIAEEPGYARGYGDGCSTAQEEDKSFSTKRYRDEESFDSDRAYRSGWRQGYQQCKRPLGEPNDGGLVLGDDNRF